MIEISKYLRKACVFTVLAATLPAWSLSTTYYASQSLLSQGNWVKVRVSQTGMQQITAEQLQQMGFSDPSRVAVYGYGGSVLNSQAFSEEMPDDLIPQPVIVENGKLIFYGQNGVSLSFEDADMVDLRENYYSDQGYYFLTDSQTPLAPEVIPFNESASTQVSRNFAMNFYGPNLYNPHSCGAFFFSRELKLGNKESFTFDFPDFEGDASMTFYMIFGMNATSGSMLWTLPLDRSGVQPTRTISFDRGHDKTFFVPKYALWRSNPAKTSDGKYTFQAQASATTLTWAGVDFIVAYYSRPSKLGTLAQQRQIYQQVSANNCFVVSTATANTRVWDVTDPTAPRAHETRFVSSGKTVRFTNNRTYTDTNCNHTLVFDPTRELHSVEAVGPVAPQNIHGMATPDMLIIASANYMDAAERLANIHRDIQGLDVLVLDQEQIFNEFSSGTPHAHAYRRCAKMFYDRDNSKFRHLLLLGNASFNNLGVGLADNFRDENLLTYETEDYACAGTHATAFVSDDYFGMLSDDFNIENISDAYMSINVGRIPAGSKEKARTAINKIERYLKNPPLTDVYNRAVMMSDDGDNNTHMGQSEEAIGMIRDIAPTVTTIKAHNSIYPWESSSAAALRTVITNALTKGAYYWSYSGHGNPTFFGAEYIWSRYYTDNTDYSFAPFTMLATCTALNYDATNENIALSMLFKENGGSIAVVGAAREVFRDYNQDINTAVAREFYSAKEGTTLGDVYRRGRNLVLDEHPNGDEYPNPNRINNLCYNFAGDPALPLYAPKYKVNVESIAGVAATPGQTFTIHPVEKVEVTGAVVDDEGQTVDTFNGSVVITLYDTPRTLPVLLRGSADKAGDIELDEDVLVEVRAKVVNGRFTADVVPPSSLSPEGSNRMSIFAVADDNTTLAVGAQTGITRSAYDESLAVEDNVPPVIDEMYINSPAFVNGDEVNGEFMLYATVLPDPSGINTAAKSIGMSAKLTLDGNRTFSAISSSISTDDEGYARVAFPLTDIHDGRHELTLSLTDNVGNRATRSVSFVVRNTPVDVVLAVEERPARTEANFTVSHNFSGTPTGRLVVENSLGESVYSAGVDNETFSWNLRDLNGDPVPQGLYKAYVILNEGSTFASSPRTDVIVID